jgi:hypothetical protein
MWRGRDLISGTELNTRSTDVGLLIAVGLLTRPAAMLVTAHFVVVFVADAGDAFGQRVLGLCHPRVG